MFRCSEMSTVGTSPSAASGMAMWTREGNRVHIGIPEAAEGEVPTVDISLQRNMLYGSYAPTQPHAPHN